MRHITSKARALSSNNARRSICRRTMSSNKKSGADGAAAVSKTKTNPKVADQAAKTKAERSNATGSGGGGAGLTVLSLGMIVGGGGITAYKLKTDPTVASSMRNYGLGSVVNGFGKIITLAKEEESISKDKGTTSSTFQGNVTDQNNSEDTSSDVSSGVSPDLSSEKGSAAADQNGDNASIKQKNVNQEKEDGQEAEVATKVEAETADEKISGELREEAQDAAVSAVVASGKVQENVEEQVKATLHEVEEDAMLVAEMKSKPSEKETLRQEVLDIERSVTEQQTEVRRNTVSQLRVNQAQLRGELEDMLARDLSELNIEKLRRRVVSLVMELQERNKSEAAQLIAVLENAEQKASKKSVDALREQSEKYEDLIRISLREQEVKLQDDYAKRLDEYIAESTLRIQQISDDLKAAHAQDLEAKLALSRMEQEAEIAAVASEESAASYARADAVQAARVATVEDLRLKLQALDKVFQINAEYLSNSHQIHLVSTALLALYNALSASGGNNSRRSALSGAVASLRVAACSDPIIVTALESLPKSALAGIPTLSELEVRFTNACEESRKALYTPEGSGVVGHALGSVAAGLLVAPSGSNIEGEDTEACLARARHHISSGNIRSALQEVRRIEGDAAAVMVDWVEAAQTRLLVEQAVKMIGAHVTTLVATLS
jgi:hypothetical protein